MNDDIHHIARELESTGGSGVLFPAPGDLSNYETQRSQNYLQKNYRDAYDQLVFELEEKWGMPDHLEGDDAQNLIQNLGYSSSSLSCAFWDFREVKLVISLEIESIESSEASEKRIPSIIAFTKTYYN